jgi:hypothetical protein
MRESDFQRAVVDLAKLRGWKVAWTWNSMHSPKGWPDLFMARDGQVVVAELKVNAKLTPEQAEWLWILAGTGKCKAYCWRPSCWKQIERVLSPYQNGGSE